MKYIGKECVYCKKTFTPDDDIVVCPECGSPHHRQCYKEKNRCAFEELHAEGFSWQLPDEAPEGEDIPDGTVICTSCGMPMAEDDEFCPHCNEPNEELIQKRKFTAEQDKGFRHIFGIDPNSDMGGVKAVDLIIFVRVNVLYYAAYFKQIALANRKLSMNILCLFFPSIYFANRRMWLWAIVSSVISVLLTIPYAISMLAEMSTSTYGTQIFSERVINMLAENSGTLNSAINICNGLDFVFRLIFCLFANLLYYRFAVRSIKKMKGKAGEELLSHADLARAGGIRLLNTPLMILMSAAMTMMAVYASVMILENYL